MSRVLCRALTLTALCAGLVVIFACHSKPTQPANEKHYDIEGRVVSVDKAAGTITLDHKEIPGFMPAMIMPYKVRDKWAFDFVKPGDHLRATLAVADDEGFLENISVTQDSGSESSTSPVNLPHRGDAIPDFHFVDQNGRPVHIAQFKGAPLLLTFIYTRCPLPDYCIRMSGNFAEVAKRLKQNDPAEWKKVHLLSISIDPDYDKPPILRAYGKSYAGEVDPKFEHWKFASGTPAETKKAAEFFGLSYEKQSGQIIHSLRTALIGADGKLVDLYSGNTWKPEEVADQIAGLK